MMCDFASGLRCFSNLWLTVRLNKLPVDRNIDGEQPLRAMDSQQSACEALADVVAHKPPSSACATLPATSLLDLPDALLESIASLAVQLGAGNALSLACRAFSLVNLQRAPAFHFPLERLRCDQLLTRRAIAALRARNNKLTFAMPHQPRRALLTHILAKLGPCAAAESCKLSYSGPPRRGRFKALDCSQRLAQHLLGAFPGLTALSLHGFSVSSSGLATLLSHPQLSLQLQQLDLSSTTILQLQQQPGALALNSPFHGAGLKQLRLDIACMGQHEPNLPDLQPLAQHLTQLHLQSSSRPSRDVMALDLLLDQLLPLAKLQVLTVHGVRRLHGLPELLPALPHLHTLQLPDAYVQGQQQLDALVAATHLQSVHLAAIGGLTSLCVDTPINWQLSLAKPMDWVAVLVPDVVKAARYRFFNRACQSPMTAERLVVFAKCPSAPAAVEAAAAEVVGSRHSPSAPSPNRRHWEQLVAALQPLPICCAAEVEVVGLYDVSVEDAPVLAALSQGCTQLVFKGGSISPSQEFWRQLVQLMPTLKSITLDSVKSEDSVARIELTLARAWVMGAAAEH
ncbi:hypothetical protein V8C86DRAFT_84131 [Haematococcus lacustris]